MERLEAVDGQPQPPPPHQQQQQQNVHLHMHHICPCQAFYPTTHYAPIGYRTPILAYATTTSTTTAAPRSYLPPPYYQYGQYTLGAAATTATATTTTTNNRGSYIATTAITSAAIPHQSLELNRQDDGTDMEHVTPPANNLILFEDDNQQINPTNFIKFLEHGCLTAEQIAYRNRSRPCFRNIQNLCIRTRTEIMKPCATIANIHSQGIPWVTKDFIYAFIRLTNCWHILRGYWDYRDGIALGKIGKELTPEFRLIYMEWELATVKLAGELTRIFYDLDTNLMQPKTTNNILSTPSKKNVRGLLHVPTKINEMETKANHIAMEGDGDAAIYNHKINKKLMDDEMKTKAKQMDAEDEITTKPLPRLIEFLDTAQNIPKTLEIGNWTKMKIKPREIDDIHVLISDWLKNFLKISIGSQLNRDHWLTSNDDCFDDDDDGDDVKLMTTNRDLGLTKTQRHLLMMVLNDLKQMDVAKIIADCDLMNLQNFDQILLNLNKNLYQNMDDINKDLRDILNYVNAHSKTFNCTTDAIKTFSHKLEMVITLNFSNINNNNNNDDDNNGDKTKNFTFLM